MALSEQITEREPELRRQAITRAQAYLRKRAEEKIIKLYKGIDILAAGTCLALLAVLVWLVRVL